jgi:NAD+ diphosphatase
MLTQAVEDEIRELSLRYGEPRRIQTVLSGGVFDPLNRSDRFGEVCMVVRRTNGKLITAIKTFYPAGAFRLLTGGVNHGESLFEALQREVAEETGLDVEVQRFLAVIEYQLPVGQAVYHFATFAFLLDERGGELTVHDPGERIGAFREVAPAELLELAQTLDTIESRFDEEIHGDWADWGRFRAVVHQAVYYALQDE